MCCICKNSQWIFYSFFRSCCRELARERSNWYLYTHSQWFLCLFCFVFVRFNSICSFTVLFRPYYLFGITLYALRTHLQTRVVEESEKRESSGIDKMAQELMISSSMYKIAIVKHFRKSILAIFGGFKCWRIFHFICGTNRFIGNRHMDDTHRWFSSVLLWPSSVRGNAFVFKPIWDMVFSLSLSLLDYPNERFCTCIQKISDDHPLLGFSFFIVVVIRRNPLAILVIINYSKWINLTRHRTTTKVIFESVAEMYTNVDLPIKLTLKNIYINEYLAAPTMVMCIEITLKAFGKIRFFSHNSQRQSWRWWWRRRRRQRWREMKFVCMRASASVCVCANIGLIKSFNNKF